MRYFPISVSTGIAINVIESLGKLQSQKETQELSDLVRYTFELLLMTMWAQEY